MRKNIVQVKYWIIKFKYMLIVMLIIFDMRCGVYGLKDENLLKFICGWFVNNYRYVIQC